MPVEDSWMCFGLGFDLASRGEAGIRAALTQMQEAIGAPTDGPKKKFGDLYDRLAFDLTSADYAPFRELVRDHIATTWPLGPGDDLMGEPILACRVHSVLTAARELGMDNRRLRKLLAEAGLVRPSGEGRPDAWELFEVADAATFLSGIDALVSAQDLQTALSISRSQFELLRKDGYLAPALDGDDHKPLWDLRAARRFVEGLVTGAEPIYVPMHQWADLAKAAQRLKTRPGAIVRLIEAGRLRRIGRHMTKDGYASVLVTLDEVERLLARPEAPGISIAVFARQSGLKTTAATRLVRMRHVPSTEGPNPKTRGAQRFLSSADIAAFHERFVTLRGLAVELGQSRQALRRDLAQRGVSPFSPDGADYGAIYERSVIRAAFV